MTNTATRIGRGKAREAYDLCHLAWRAGAISSWYYGKRSASDPTVVWAINGIELPGKDHAQVVLHATAALQRRGIVSAAFGSTFCGYRELVLTYATGARVVQRYDGRTVVVETLAAAA